MFLIFYFLSLIATFCVNGLQKNDPNCETDAMDRCAVQLFGYGDRDSTFADTKNAVHQQCK